jgi:hypothetical protein
MTTDHVDRFVALCAAGSGLLVAGGLNLLPLGSRGRAVAVGLPCAAALAAVAAWGNGLALAAGAVALGLALGLLPGARPVARLAAALGRPAPRWGLVAVTGLGVAVASGIRYEAEESDALDRELVEMDLEDMPPALNEINQRAYTDRGTPIPLKSPAAPRATREIEDREAQILAHRRLTLGVIRQRPADDRTNCHGWVFTGGRYWVSGESIDQIIRENGYQEVATPRPGDLAVYRVGDTPAHTAVVRYATNGLPVLVEGKWSWMGVYLHAVDQSLYGRQYKFYRPTRPSHLLAGLDIAGES